MPWAIDFREMIYFEKIIIAIYGAPGSGSSFPPTRPQPHISPMLCVLLAFQAFVGLCKQFPAQIVALAAQVSWSGSVLNALKDAQIGSVGGLKACLEGLSWRLLAMSESVLGESPPALRRKYEQLITELVRQRDATRRLQVVKRGGVGWSEVEWHGDPFLCRRLSSSCPCI